MIRVACAGCGRVGEFHPAFAGTRVKCKGCPEWLQVAVEDDGQPQRCESCGFQVKVGRMNACPQCGKRFAGAPHAPEPRVESKPAPIRPPPTPILPDSPAERLAALPVFRDEIFERQHRLGMAIVCLHIVTVIYTLIAIFCLYLFVSVARTDAGLAIGFGLTLFCASLAIGSEFVVAGLRERRFWAWIVGVILFVMFLPSAFLPLGVFGLWGLLDADSRAEFGIGGGGRNL